jgi:hypothetical protein
MDWWINYRLAQQRLDGEILDRTFRHARGIARRRATTKHTTGNLSPRLPNVKGSIIVIVATDGSTPVAILVEGDCTESSVDCVSKYLVPRCVGGANDGQNCTSDAGCPKRCLAGTNNGNPCTTDANCPAGSCQGACDKGLLGDTATYLPASSWGAVQVRAGEFRPDSLYHVFSVCNLGGTPTVSAAAHTRTPKWGNCNGDNNVDFGDISAVVNAFKNTYSPVETYQSTNLLGSGATACGDPQAGCSGQGCIEFGDVAAAVDAFRGNGFTCPAICP